MEGRVGESVTGAKRCHPFDGAAAPPIAKETLPKACLADLSNSPFEEPSAPAAKKKQQQQQLDQAARDAYRDACRDAYESALLARYNPRLETWQQDPYQEDPHDRVYIDYAGGPSGDPPTWHPDRTEYRRTLLSPGAAKRKWMLTVEDLEEIEPLDPSTASAAKKCRHKDCCCAAYDTKDVRELAVRKHGGGQNLLDKLPKVYLDTIGFPALEGWHISRDSHSRLPMGVTEARLAYFNLDTLSFLCGVEPIEYIPRKGSRPAVRKYAAGDILKCGLQCYGVHSLIDRLRRRGPNWAPPLARLPRY